MKSVLLVSVSVFALTGAALAADMSVPYAKAPMMMPVAPAWAGWYLGIQGGLAQNYSNWNDLDAALTPASSHNINKTGGIFGGNIGYNWQDRSFVYGLEFDMNWVGAKASEIWDPNFNNRSVTQSADMTWLGSFRGRVGLDVEWTLFYLTGGLAFGGVKISAVSRNAAGVVLDSMSVSDTKVGWTAGVGLEHMFAGKWTARAEVRYTDLGSSTVNCTGTSICQPGATTYRGQFSNQLWTGMVGLGYKF
jgi:outer membrane immunogenic protein